LKREQLGERFAQACCIVSALTLVLKHLELCLRLHAAVPWLDPQVASDHVMAAQAAATGPVTSELLLGMAFVESRFDPLAVSRVEGGIRKTGRYPSTAAPARLNPRTSLYCGPLQAFAPSWPACMQMRDLTTGYAAAASELTQWLRDQRVRGNVPLALAGHGCGNYGVRTGSCNGYQSRVLRMERQLRYSGERRRDISRAVVANM
jgi:hypothetical protein